MPKDLNTEVNPDSEGWGPTTYGQFLQELQEGPERMKTSSSTTGRAALSAIRNMSKAHDKGRAKEIIIARTKQMRNPLICEADIVACGREAINLGPRPDRRISRGVPLEMPITVSHKCNKQASSPHYKTNT